MPLKKRRFTSSIRMVDSKVSPKILSLGKQIVSDLGMADDVDTLGRWISHYLAERIAAAEQEADPERRKLLNEECCKLVIELWDHRACLPGRVAPLAGLNEIVRAITDLRTSESPYWRPALSRNTNGNPWLRFAREAERHALALVRLSIFHALAESVLPQSAQKIAMFRDSLSEDEVRIIEELQRLVNDTDAKYSFMRADIAVETDPAQREQKALQAMESRLEQLGCCFDELKRVRNGSAAKKD